MLLLEGFFFKFTSNTWDIYSKKKLTKFPEIFINQILVAILNVAILYSRKVSFHNYVNHE